VAPRYANEFRDAPQGQRALLLSALSWLCCFPLAIVAASMASTELKAIKEGLRSPSQIRHAQVALVVSVLNLIFYGLTIMGWVGAVVFG